MNIQRTTFLGILGAVFVFGLVRIPMAAHWQSRLLDLQAAQTKQLAEKKNQWAEARGNLQESLERELEDERISFTNTLITLQGGHVPAIAKRPNQTVPQLLQNTVAACLPAGAKATVKVDRFTEFSILIDLASKPTRGELVSISACFLPYTAAYLHQVVYRFQGSMLAEIGKQALESVTDWNGLSRERFAALFDWGSEDGPEAVPAVSTALPPEDRQEPVLVQEQRRVSRVFYDEFNRANQELTEAVRALQRAVDLKKFESREERSARLESITVAESRLKWAHAVLSDPPGRYEQLLREARFVPAYIRASVRGCDRRYGFCRVNADDLFRRAQDLSKATRSYLTLLITESESWSFDTSGEKFLFSQPRVANEFTSRRDELNLRMTEFGRALKNWNDSFPKDASSTPL